MDAFPSFPLGEQDRTPYPSTKAHTLLFLNWQVGLTDDERDSRHHYLKELEGCSAGLLADVQAAFEDLYGLLRSLLDHSLGTGQVAITVTITTTTTTTTSIKYCIKYCGRHSSESLF